MTLLSKKIKFVIECLDNELARIIKETLEPENKLLGEKTKIKTVTDNKNVIIEIQSSASISSLRHTIDDIVHTVATIEGVYKSVNN
ncbi:MAG: KEOPS complex subunit Pcc1 [Candidatus Heimdallarchaeaceae archaeon]|jgi:tRNA threonylcarbamoyladenosine modification (KEOPS) complex  Pcc1 subunit